jgi:hypothetical protein
MVVETLGIERLGMGDAGQSKDFSAKMSHMYTPSVRNGKLLIGMKIKRKAFLPVCTDQVPG